MGTEAERCHGNRVIRVGAAALNGGEGGGLVIGAPVNSAVPVAVAANSALQVTTIEQPLECS